jgi:hypothetical protein
MFIVYIIIIIIIIITITIIICQIYSAVIFIVTVCTFKEVLTSILPSKGSASIEILPVRN